MKQIALAAVLTLPLAATAQSVEDDANVAGTMTATINADEVALVVVTNGERSSGFQRVDGDVVVNVVALPDRTPTAGTPTLELEFRVTGMGPTADATDATVNLTMDDGRTLSTLGGSSEVSLTAFGLESDEVTVAGSFASQLQDEAGGMAEAAVEGDFQASIRQPDFATTN